MSAPLSDLHSLLFAIDRSAIISGWR